MCSNQLLTTSVHRIEFAFQAKVELPCVSMVRSIILIFLMKSSTITESCCSNEWKVVKNLLSSRARTYKCLFLINRLKWMRDSVKEALGNSICESFQNLFLWDSKESGGWNEDIKLMKSIWESHKFQWLYFEIYLSEVLESWFELFSGISDG